MAKHGKHSKTKAEHVPTLLKTHSQKIGALKSLVFSALPELASLPKSTLSDGTKLDDLFFLRYLLSIKNETLQQTSEHITEHLSWRQQQIKSNSDWINNTHHGVDKKFLSKVPLHRTGELADLSPVIVLPVEQIDFEYLFHSDCPKFEKEVLNFMLSQKEKIFRELDEKTRKHNEIVKCVTVYDLANMSYSKIYKLTKFFKLLQSHTKVFKQYYPQSTSKTVILNSPGSWLIKMFNRSSKQEVMSVGEFLTEFNAKNAVPKFLGGTALWPTDKNYSKTVVHNKVSDRTGEKADSIKVKKIESDSVLVGTQNKTKENLSVTPNKQESELVLKLVENERNSKKFDEKKVVLTFCEREFIYMKKNKIFSIDVLESDQKVHIHFINRRNKTVNVLIAIREMQKNKLSQTFNNANSETLLNKQDKNMYSIINTSTVLKEGFNRLTLNVTDPSEILMIYVSEKNCVKNSDYSNLNQLKLSGNQIHKKMYRKARDLLKKNEYSISKYDENKDGKVFFWFEVSENVLPGNFSGNKSLSTLNKKLDKQDLEECDKVSVLSEKSVVVESEEKMDLSEFKNRVRRNSDGLLEYDDRQSLATEKRNDGWMSFLWA